ncbi:MAG TPA: DUF5818 domain-containing protein [Terracidiphilus sp.]|nr:DUF5818 domain-containing protein [Terracidiphilus sp.]
MKSLKNPYVLALSACMLTLLATPVMAAPVASIGTPMPLIQTPQPQMPDQQTQAEPAAKTQTFTGTISQQGSDFVLEASGSTYKLSGADNAKSFVGKSVTVIGTLDSSTNTIAVQSIRGASI